MSANRTRTETELEIFGLSTVSEQVLVAFMLFAVLTFVISKRAQS